jgi:hypothetical protein
MNTKDYYEYANILLSPLSLCYDKSQGERGQPLYFFVVEIWECGLIYIGKCLCEIQLGFKTFISNFSDQYLVAFNG